MARITVIGGTGYGGAAVVREAARRGHSVVAISRSEPAEPVPGVEYVAGSVLDPDVLERAVKDTDVVFEAISPRGDMADKAVDAFLGLARAADHAGVRLGVLGGVSSVLVAPGGPTLFETSTP